ncbi:MAG: hypothetical protein OES25_15105 [Acidobacteriota bacterium]|nr:hypothetical protein [Acidobacteriota bacterium]
MSLGSPLTFDFSGIQTTFHGLPAGVAQRLQAEWSQFDAVSGQEPSRSKLIVHCVEDPPLQNPGTFLPKAMRHTCDAERAEFSMPEGSVTVERDGTATMRIRPVDEGRDFYTVCNLHRAALSWSLPRFGALLMHAAGIVVGDRGFVMVGAHGAGKTTWARIAMDAGYHVVSDDVVIVDGIGRGPQIVGAPLGSTLKVKYGRGRWPLTGILAARHGDRHQLEPLSGIGIHASVVANLPFINDAVENDRVLTDQVDRLIADVPAARLTFARDPGYLSLLEAWE